jgi:hypothetical protein
VELTPQSAKTPADIIRSDGPFASFEDRFCCVVHHKPMQCVFVWNFQTAPKQILVEVDRDGS